MQCDLAGHFSTIAATIPQVRDGNHHLFLSAHNLPIPPVELNTDQLLVARLQHGYNDCYRADALWFQARKQTYTYLGLLILAVLFHPEPTSVHIALHHPASDIKHLLVEYAYPGDTYPGYHSRPYGLCYYPDDPSGYGHRWSRFDRFDLPSFYLTCWRKQPITEEEWQSRDTVRGFGSDTGSAQLAELLLNAGHPLNTITQLTLESDAGYGGVGRLSAEATFFLPGSLAWSEQDWQTP
jgi:hypothetical protein